ncbi:MAG: SMC family ATPase [Deltaproteobacteria bacterium]|nr:SMC family ATPase [Deltaproteobacteria bacterium]
MRPLRLEVSGLTCFRERTVVDFSDMSVLAIEGPTGAGKSSLLDAMMLALYGNVPRIGKQGLSELVSHGRSGLSVVFDFQIGSATGPVRWRVSRTVHRSGKAAQAILAQLIAGEDGQVVEKRLFDGVQKVQEEVKRLLGIDVDAFQQAVILPQGEFQKFLKATPRERREVLSALLGLSFYEAMRDKASRLALGLEAEVGHLDRQLAGDFEGATAEAVETLAAELEVARVALGAAQDEEARAREEVGKVERLFAMGEELGRLDRELAALEAQAEAMAEEDRRLVAARRVAGAVPLIAAEEAARIKVARDAGRLEGAEGTLATARARLEAAREEAARAELGAGEIAAARQRLAVLDEARVRIEQRDGLKREVEALRAELGRALQAREAAGQAVAAAEVEVLLAEQRLEAARAEAARSEGVQAGELERWQAARVVAARLGAARAELGREVEAVAGAVAAVGRAEQALDASEVEQRRAELREAQAADASAVAQEGLRAAEHEARVALVRSHLHVGGACPVCENTVTRVPEAGVGESAVEERRAEVGLRNTALETARRAGERARQEAALKRSAWGEARARLGELEAAVARRRGALEADESALRVVMGEAEAGRAGGLEADGGALRMVMGEAEAGRDGLGGATVAAGGSEAIEVRYGVRLAALEAAAREGAERVRAVETRAAELERARALAELKRGAAGAAADKCQAVEQRVGEVHARLAGEDARVAALNVVDPKAEKGTLEARIAGLEAAVKAAASEVSRREVAVATAEAEARAAREAGEESRASWQGAEAALMAELGRLVMTVDEVRRAALSGEQIEAREQSVAAFRAGRAAREAQRMALAEAFGRELEGVGRQVGVGAAEVAAARAAVEARAVEARAAGERVGVLGERWVQAKDKLGRADGVRAERVEKAARRDVYKRLAEDLKSNNFQDYVLGEVVEDLLRGASERLFVLSGGRYRLASGDGGGLVVVDLDHLAETRSADTLSGGETFLASLALALELSEQIQARTGPVHLDCLFIDEGFGSLDAETLETVAEAIEQLGRSGRLVGIITHVAELARRMPDRLVVAKSPEGSTVRVAA